MVKVIGILHPPGRPNNYKGTDFTKKDLDPNHFVGLPMYDNHDSSVQSIAYVEHAHLDKHGNLWVRSTDIDEVLPHGKEVVKKLLSREYGGLSLGSVNEMSIETRDVLRRCATEASFCKKGARKNTRIVAVIASADREDGKPSEIELDLLPIKAVGLMDMKEGSENVILAKEELEGVKDSAPSSIPNNLVTSIGGWSLLEGATPGKRKHTKGTILKPFDLDKMYSKWTSAFTEKFLGEVDSWAEESGKTSSAFLDTLKSSIAENISGSGGREKHAVAPLPKKFEAVSPRNWDKANNSSPDFNPSEPNPFDFKESTLTKNKLSDSKTITGSIKGKPTKSETNLTNKNRMATESKSGESHTTNSYSDSAAKAKAEYESSEGAKEAARFTPVPQALDRSFVKHPSLPVPAATDSARPRDPKTGRYLPMSAVEEQTETGTGPPPKTPSKETPENMKTPTEENPASGTTSKKNEEIVLTKEEYTQLQLSKNKMQSALEELEKTRKEAERLKEKFAKEEREKEKKSKFAQVKSIFDTAEETLKIIEELREEEKDPDAKAMFDEYRRKMQALTDDPDALYSKTPQELKEIGSNALIITKASKSMKNNLNKASAEIEASWIGRFEELQKQTEESKRLSNRKRAHPEIEGVSSGMGPASVDDSAIGSGVGSGFHAGRRTRKPRTAMGASEHTPSASLGGSAHTPSAEHASIDAARADIFKNAHIGMSYGVRPLYYEKLCHDEDPNADIFASIERRLSGGNWAAHTSVKGPFYEGKTWFDAEHSIPMSEGPCDRMPLPEFKLKHPRIPGY